LDIFGVTAESTLRGCGLTAEPASNQYGNSVTAKAVIETFGLGRRHILGWYLYVALDTVFGLSRPRRLLMVFTLLAALYVILMAYHVVVFTATLYST
jgi:hypothetical protein